MKTIPVFYDAAMVADSESFSPSAAKAKAAVQDWLDSDLPIKPMKVSPAPPEMIKLAHDGSYVDGVLAGRSLNGFNNTSEAVAAALPWQVGSLVTATLHVLSNRYGTGRASRVPVACSPSAGFHHARFSSASGYCTFNGLVIAGIVARRLGLAKRVAILDCDYHYGDGTQDIIEHIGASWITQWSAGGHYRDPSQAERFLEEALPMALSRLIGDADVLLYQAGADQHVSDPLGGLLTNEQMRQRDRIVFRTCRQYDIPVVWNLAGGYQRDAAGSIAPVLALHRATMNECAAVFVRGEDDK